VSIYKKLLAIQTELKAPKGQRNNFGNYNYRNCEDILESVKPLLKKHDCTLFIKDDVEFINSRFYIRAIVNFIDIETGEKIETSAYAREEETKKGMDGSQITGASSSYARKYALNGLFAIDDTKDSDATNKHDKAQKKEEKKDLKKEIQSMLIQLYGKTEYVAKLKEITEFEGKGGTMVQGVESLAELSEARTRATYGKVKKIFKENTEG